MTSSDVMTRSAEFVLPLVESITTADSIDAVKNLGTDYEKNLTEDIGVTPVMVSPELTINGSMFYQLFYSLNMWGYLGPIALVIVGFIASKKDAFIGIIFAIVETLIIATYLALIGATPEYWWNVLILILGIFMIIPSLRER